MTWSAFSHLATEWQHSILMLYFSFTRFMSIDSRSKILINKTKNNNSNNSYENSLYTCILEYIMIKFGSTCEDGKFRNTTTQADRPTSRAV